MCDSCVGKMNKYLLVRKELNFVDAESYCLNAFGTTLASIHSQLDHFEATILCRSLKNDCWIGLNYDSRAETFVWKNGTSIDFGDDVVSEFNISSKNEHCVIIDAKHGFIINHDCEDVSPYFLCNKPSELYHETKWTRHGDVVWTNSSEIRSENVSTSVINDKVWVYDDDIWIIDYFFTIHNVYNNYGESGVMIYHEFDINELYYYVGIGINESANDADTYIFIDKYNNSKQQPLYTSTKLFVYDFNVYYTLEYNKPIREHVHKLECLY